MTYVKRGLYTVCQVEGCDRKHCSKGWCPSHLWRVRKYGDPQAGQPLRSRAPSGTGNLTAAGYRRVVVDRQWIFEHRVVMAQVLGRPLLPHENVHHINGQRADNRPENLELWSRSQPPGQRVLDKVAWAIELLRQYDPASLNETLTQGETQT